MQAHLPTDPLYGANHPDESRNKNVKLKVSIPLGVQTPKT